MDNQIEDYQYNDHSELNFVYDEQPQSGGNKPENETHEKMKKKSVHPMIISVAAALVIIALVCTVIWHFSGREQAGETDTSQEEYSTGDDLAVYSSPFEQMEAYINGLAQKAGAQLVTESGQYMPGQYLILELDNDETYPEGLVLKWDGAQQRYALTTYFFDTDNAGTAVICEDEYVFGETQAGAGQIGMITVNRNTADGYMDIILEKHGDSGMDSSIFMRYQEHAWECLGEAEGTVGLQAITTDGEIQQMYDFEGNYCLTRAVDAFLGKYACQHWVIGHGTMYLNDQAAAARAYWFLADAPEWYMKRPVLAYGCAEYELDSTELKLLRGTTLRIMGMLRLNNAIYYNVVTDTGERGYILLDGIQLGTMCQVQLQSLPFEEVFSEKPLTASDISDDAFTASLPVLSAPVEQTMQPGEGYEAWADLNGDGIYEKIYVTSVCGVEEEVSNVSTMTMQWYINDNIILSETTNGYDIQNVQFFVMDFDPLDQWLELGYCLNTASGNQTKLWRYDGTYMRSLGLEDAMCFPGEPEWESIVRGGEEETDQLTVRGSWGEYGYQYAISLDRKTGSFYNETFTECSFDTAVLCSARESATLYDMAGRNEKVVVDAQTPLRLVSIRAYQTATGRLEYYGYFQLEDGTYAYSKAFERYRNLNAVFDLTALFGPLEG